MGEEPERLNHAGEGLLNPIPLAAIAVLLLNDHVLKDAFHNGLTGKLSDFAGLAFFPLVLQALWESVQTLLRRAWHPSRRALLVSALATALFFAAVQVWPPATEFYRWCLGALQWPVHALRAGRLVVLSPVSVWPDPWDLMALPAVAIAVWTGWSRSRGPVGQPER